MTKNYKRVKLACYASNVTMSIVGNLSPLLFLTFHTMYGISYTALGALVLINFVTQLGIDLVFSFFSHKFNIPLAVKSAPVLGIVGLVLFAVCPMLFPQCAYLGIVIGTVIFSAASGFNEVLISPVIAAIPCENPDHEMSKLHSIYAWGVVFVVAVSTAFLLVFENDNWQWLALLFALVPLLASVLFFGAELPPLKTEEKTSGALEFLKSRGLWICVFGIFLGGAAECTMAQWCSGYLENALQIPKVWGDIFGVALFAVMLGLGRTLYAKYGKNISKVLFFSAIGSTICYFTAAVSNIAVIGLFACAFTGFCTAMMWPGSLIAVAERFPRGGVIMYALMAAGGDLGASVGPQLVGVITDVIRENEATAKLAFDMGLTPDRLGMKVGILIGMLFSLIAIFVFFSVMRNQRKFTEKALSYALCHKIPQSC